jgi:hypothetical protein
VLSAPRSYLAVERLEICLVSDISIMIMMSSWRRHAPLNEVDPLPRTSLGHLPRHYLGMTRKDTGYWEA